MRTMMSAKTATGRIRTKVPSKQMSSSQKMVLPGTDMKTDRERMMDYKKRLKET